MRTNILQNRTNANSSRTTSPSPREGRELSSGEGEPPIDSVLPSKLFLAAPSPRLRPRLSRRESKVVCGRTPVPWWQHLERNGLSLLASTFLLAVIGCGGAGYGEVPVSGQVTYDGEPLAHVHLSFQPVAKDKSGFGPGSFGRTDEDGKFELRTVHPDALGAVAGEHRITISYEDPSQRPKGIRIPRDYAEGKAKFEVPSDGTDSAVIEITSK